MLVGPGVGWRRAWSVGLGAAIPVAALLAYNVATTGQLFHPAYDHLYRLEARAYTSLGYHPDWAAEDPRYLPQNLGIMLFATPELLPERLRDTLGTIDQPLCTSPGATRGLFDVSCPLALPRDTGMSILLTSPAFLLAIPALLDRGRRRIVTRRDRWRSLLVSIANLMHFSQGWVQFGYRFATTRYRSRSCWSRSDSRGSSTGSRPAAGRCRSPWRWSSVSVAINAWGVAWGRLLGW